MFCFVIAFLDSNYFHKNFRSSITSDYLGNETLVRVNLFLSISNSVKHVKITINNM